MGHAGRGNGQSGILAIYGAMLGAFKIVAIDIDPEALRWAERNIELNNFSAVITLSSIPLKDLEDRFSVVTANLTLNVIIELLPNFFRILETDGCLILSGILRDQFKPVEKELKGHGFYKDQVITKEEWACVIVKKVSTRLSNILSKNEFTARDAKHVEK